MTAADGHWPADFLRLLPAMCGNARGYSSRDQQLALAAVCVGVYDSDRLPGRAAGVSIGYGLGQQKTAEVSAPTDK